MPERTIESLCQRSHELSRSKGWYNGEEKDPRPIKLITLLMQSELIEALEEWRNNHKLDEVYFSALASKSGATFTLEELPRREARERGRRRRADGALPAGRNMPALRACLGAGLMGWLILRVSKDGREPFDEHARRHALAEPTFADAQTFARKHGYELLLPVGIKSAKRAEWPLSAHVYTSRRRDGVGRSGSSLYTYPARIVPCPVCFGLTFLYDECKDCYRCRGTGRDFRGSRATS